MLQNKYLVAKIGADTAENERNFAEILPKIGNYPTPLAGFGEGPSGVGKLLRRAVAEAPLDGPRLRFISCPIYTDFKRPLPILLRLNTAL